MLYMKTGDDICKTLKIDPVPKACDKQCGSTHVYAFADNPWGSDTCSLTKRSKELCAKTWESIIHHASIHLSPEDKEALEGKTDCDDDGDDGPEDLHACIDLDW
jgi:hypothetical protein